MSLPGDIPEGWPYSPIVYSRQSSGIVWIVLDIRYYGASIACARAVIGNATGLPGRGQAPIAEAEAAARARAS
jgi:hypothetical protein